jgi:uncharacterized protein YndB with AHSA1/START domain
MSESRSTPGQKSDDGWDVGVRKTVDASPETVWKFLIGEGLPAWLGDIESLPSKKGVRYQTRDGVRGTIRAFVSGKQVRLTWQPEDWPHDTTLQVTVANAPRGAGATVEFRHEELADRDERRMMLGHWHNVSDLLVNHFA